MFKRRMEETEAVIDRAISDLKVSSSWKSKYALEIDWGCPFVRGKRTSRVYNLRTGSSPLLNQPVNVARRRGYRCGLVDSSDICCILRRFFPLLGVGIVNSTRRWT